MRAPARQRWLVGLLCVAILASGTPRLAADAAAQRAAQRWGAVVRAQAATVDGQPGLLLGAPPDPNERRLLTVTASGANPPYPLNQTFDGERQALAAAANAGFEAAPWSVGAPPANSDLSAAAADAGAPVNFDFASGDLVGWTTSGAVSAASDPTQGTYAALGANGVVVTAAFTVAADAQAFTLDYAPLAASGYNQATVSILTGATYATSTTLAAFSCNPCAAAWETTYFDATPYLGQSVKLKVSRSSGTIGIDAARARVSLPGLTTSGAVARGGEASGNTYAALGAGGVITTGAFTVATDAQFGDIQVRGLSGFADQVYVYVLSGASFATSTRVATNLNVPDGAWTRLPFNLVAWRGQSIELQVTRQYGRVGVDDLGTQRVDVPGWEPSKDAALAPGGVTGNAVSLGGSLTSDAFTIAADAQQLTLAYQQETNSIFYVELLRGSGFATVTDIGSGAIGDAAMTWKTLTLGVTAYQGETVRLRVRQYFGRGRYDDVGIQELTVPGWTLVSGQGMLNGADANGTYVTPARGGAPLAVQSSDIATGIIDTAARVEQRFYAVSYAIGAQTGSLVRVTWYDRATAKNWVVYQDAADTPTGYRTRYFWLADFMGTDGYFVAQVPPGGRLYSIADNIARQQLAEPFSEKAGQGIDTTTGGFGYQAQDLATQGDMPLVFTRYYVGQSDRVGTLGYRWSQTYDTRLDITQDGDAGVVFGSGREEFFDWLTPPGGASSFAPADPRVRDTLVKNPDGTYSLTTTSNLTLLFTSTGQLTSISDLNGNTVALAYDGAGRLAIVAAPGGRALTLAYDGAGRLASVTDPVGAVVTYGYDANGDLTSVIDAGGSVWTYRYDKHRLARVVDPTGATLFTNTFDTVNRLTSQTDAAGASITIAYDAPATGATRVTDPLNRAATYYFDRYGRTTDKVDPDGRVVSNVYDGVGNLQKVIDRSTQPWQFAYDANGQVTGSTDPLGNPTSIAYTAQRLPAAVTDARGNVTSYTYDADGNVLTKTDPLTNTWTYTYDAAGHKLTETDPLGNTTSYTYDAAGNRLTKTDPLTNTWTWTYDAAGRVLTETNPLNQTTTYAYNVAGDLERVTDPLGGATQYYRDLYGNLEAQQDALGNAILWDYDARALIVAVTDQAGKVTTYDHDAAGNTTAMTDPLGRVTSWTYDALNRVVAETDALNRVTAYAYDAAGRLARETDPLNRVTSYGYDAAGRLMSKTLPNGGIYAYAYDPNGNLLSETDPLGHATTYAYDAANRLTARTDPLGKTTGYAYDAVGRLLSITDPLNETTAYVYDAAGRLVSVTDPLGNVTSYGYDAANRRTSVTNPLNQMTTYGYDAAGRLTSVTDPLGDATTYAYDAVGRRTRVTRASGASTDYAYDPRGLLLSVTDPLGHATTYAYDAAGRRVAATDPLNRATTYGYDAANHLTAMTDALGGTVSYAYDAAGQRTAVTNPRGKTTTYAYDALGNVLRATDPLGRARTSSYDLAGRLIGTTDARGTSVGYAYDAADNLTAVTYPGGGVTYAYDDAGRQVSMADPTGITTYAYDAAGRTTSVAAPQGTVGYAYDAAGQRTALTLPGDRAVTYAYDAAGRLTSATDPYARATTYAYDVNNKRTSISRPNGVTTTFGYDAEGRLTALDHAGAGLGSLQSYAYTYDAANNRTSATSAAGTERYTLDALDRLTNVTYPNGDTAAYTYDATGNRLTATVNGTTTATYTYDDADQLTSDGTQTYAYDANGNLTAAGADAFTWDWADRLASATTGGATTTYAYDGAGARVGKTSNGATAAYLWDRAGGLPQLASDGATTYLQAGGATEELDAAGGPRYTLADALGSTRGVTDGAGALLGTTDYAAFGAVRAQTGAQSALGYTGEQRDAETGFTYLRARYADPATGRFLSADTVQPNAPGTQGYNRYAYVANNPTTWTDPSGQVATAVAAAPFLLPEWLPIGLALAALFIADCAANSPLGICSGLAQFVITALVVAACVLDVGGPCWGLKYGDASTHSDATARAKDGATDKTGPDVAQPPDPTPPSDPNCIDNPVPWGSPPPQGRDDIPEVSNQKLKNIINDLFKPEPQAVPGGTAGAIREELRTGEPVQGKFHVEKGRQYINALSNAIKSGQLSEPEKQIAEWLENDLLNALFGC